MVAERWTDQPSGIWARNNIRDIDMNFSQKQASEAGAKPHDEIQTNKTLYEWNKFIADESMNCICFLHIFILTDRMMLF